MEKEYSASGIEVKISSNLDRKLLKISWPIFIEFALFMLLGSIDTFMLGRYSDNAVASVGVVNQIISMINLIFNIITAGTTIICAQYIGAKKKDDDMFKLIGTSIGVNTFLGVILSIFLFVFSTQLLKAMNISNELLEFGKSYLNIVGGFILLQAIASTFTAIIRSYGFTKICMYAALIMNIVNIVFNYLFIYGNFGAPRLGVTGAAIATTLSKVIGIVILGIYLFRKVIKGFKVKYITTFHKDEFNKILKMGAPAAGESISYNLAKLVCTYILTYISVAALTTNSYINNIAMYIYIFSVAIGQGTAILVGQLVGKDDRETAYKLCLSSLKKAFIASTVMSIVVALLGNQIFGIFTSNKEIISLGVTILFVNILLEPGRTFNVVVINSLRAAGDVRFPVYVGIVSMWVIGVGLSYILAIPLGFGFPGMWFALALDEWVRGVIMYFRWKSRKWHGKAMV